jgi:hypothetical protein
VLKNNLKKYHFIIVMDTQTALENCRNVIIKLCELYTSVRILERDEDDEIQFPKYSPSKISEFIRLNRLKNMRDADADTTYTPIDGEQSPPPRKPEGTQHMPCCDMSLYSSKTEWCVMLRLLFEELGGVLEYMTHNEMKSCEYELYDTDELNDFIIKNNEYISSKYENNLDN